MHSRYDYRNKETDNSRNEYSSKTMRTSYGIWTLKSQGTAKENVHVYASADA